MVDSPYKINVGKQAFSEIVKNSVGFVVFALVALVALFFSRNYFIFMLALPVLGFFVFALIVGTIYNLFYLNAISYSYNEREFNLKGGIIARFEKILPYSRIQHVIITRNYIQRLFGLSSIIIQTASPTLFVNYNNQNRDPFVGSPQVPGLNKEDAIKLKDYLISRISKSKREQGL
jgi:membrane protein YdbS with pleckstrin-like domain